MKIFAYSVELNINGLDERLIKAMEDIGKNYKFDVIHHGIDCLVFASDEFNGFTYLIRDLSGVCEAYGVDYTSLLI